MVLPKTSWFSAPDQSKSRFSSDSRRWTQDSRRIPVKTNPSKKRVCGLNKSEAEDLMDWLESRGIRGLAVSREADDTFSVSYPG
jgi:hypothetical protein